MARPYKCQYLGGRFAGFAPFLGKINRLFEGSNVLGIFDCVLQYEKSDDGVSLAGCLLNNMMKKKYYATVSLGAPPQELRPMK